MATRLPPQRVAVTGASGLIGTALVGHLRSEGHTVQRLVRRPAIARDRAPSARLRGGNRLPREAAAWPPPSAFRFQARAAQSLQP